MSTKEINRRHKTEHNSKALQKREDAYDILKNELAKTLFCLFISDTSNAIGLA